MKTIELTAPSVWASYLFYDDAFALSEGEDHTIDAWRIEHGAWQAIACEDAGFMRWHDAAGYALAADCQKYTFTVREDV